MKKRSVFRLRGELFTDGVGTIKNNKVRSRHEETGRFPAAGRIIHGRGGNDKKQ